MLSNGSESANRKRYSSIDKPIVDMPKRQSAMVGDCNNLLNEALINGSIHEDKTLERLAEPGSGEKRTSRGSLNKHAVSSNRQNQYFSNH